jgi:hypothetical protein
MDFKVTWSPEAIEDLESIAECGRYLMEHDADTGSLDYA